MSLKKQVHYMLVTNMRTPEKGSATREVTDEAELVA